MYIEYVLLENFIINFFIISSTSKLLKLSHNKVFLGVFEGTLVAVLCPLFNLNIWSSLGIKIFLSLLITVTCFYTKIKRKFIINYLTFLMITFVFGGGVTALKQICSDLSILLVLVSTFIIFVILKLLIKFIGRKKIVDNFSTKVIILDGQKCVEENGYYDSGNLLYDPITSQPICLITQEVFSRLYGVDILSVFLKKFNIEDLKNSHYIKVNSALSNGKMLVFTVDKMVLKEDKREKIFENVCLGLSFSQFDKAMNSQVLLHSSQI